MKIAIASGKGGTGKTTLAVNLAAFMAPSDRVVLTDLDVEEPNAALFLEGEVLHHEAVNCYVPRWDKDLCNNCGLCQEVCNFHAVLAMPKEVILFPELCHGCYACSELCPSNALPMEPHKSGTLRHFRTGRFDLVEGRLDVGQEQAVPVIEKAKEYVADRFRTFDTIEIYDSPPGTSCPVVAATRDADFVILVTEPTPFGLNDLTLAVDVMREMHKDIAVVVNRYGIGNDDVLAFCDDSSIPVIATIPDDRRIAEIYTRGELAYPAIPELKSELEKITVAIYERARKAVL